MSWKIIMFENGSNPYICKTEKEFERISHKYELQKTNIQNYYFVKEK